MSDERYKNLNQEEIEILMAMHGGKLPQYMAEQGGNLGGDPGDVTGLSPDAQGRIAKSMKASADALERQRQGMIAAERSAAKSAIIDVAFAQAIAANGGEPLTFHQKVQILERYE